MFFVIRNLVESMSENAFLSHDVVVHVNLVVDVEPVIFEETVLLWIGTFHLKERQNKCFRFEHFNHF